MRRLALRFATAVAALSCVAAFLIAPHTGAQTGYPPGTTTSTVVPGATTTTSPGQVTTTTRPGQTTTTTPGQATTTVPGQTTTTLSGAVCTTPRGSQDVGGVNVGASFTVRIQPVCLFDVGSLVSLNVNGQGIGTKEADVSGGINVAVRVVSQTTIEIDDPITVTAQCGANTIVATGESNGTPVTQTASFTILCPGGGAAKAVRGRVAFTGANLLRWGGGAAVLVALGVVLLVTARRRSRATSA